MFKSFVKNVLAFILFYSGFIGILRILGQNYTKILLYHSICNNENNFIKAWILCELPAKMEGYYTDKNGKINLKGDCKIVPLRVPTSFGHNSLKLNFLLPPRNFGLKINIDSHYLKKQIRSNIQIAPKPKFKFQVNKIGK